MRALGTIVVILCLMALFTGCEEDTPQEDSVFDETALLEYRKDKDESFRGDESPLPVHKRDAFTGLRYYEPDADYVVESTFSPEATPDTIVMPTTHSDVRRALRMGVLRFTLRNKKCSLAAYRFMDGGSTSFFVPFTDASNGGTTYESGRYMDIEMESTDSLVVLDFNMAYNPFCAYNPEYSCPLVPHENNLNIVVAAGEKK